MPTLNSSNIDQQKLSTLKVLLAEDNLVNQKLASLLFKKLGLVPDIVPTGTEAVSRVMEDSYDLVFMDVYMPEMDGTEATRILKAELGADCPFVVALTAASMEGEKEKFLAAGMDDYLAKPLNKKMLEDFFEKFLQ